MNEEEILNMIQNLINGVEEYGFDFTFEECVVINKNEYNAIQGLLDLYKQEKEIEQLHKEENGKLRVELEQYKLLEANIDKANKIIAENKFDEGLYGLLMQEKEKNKELRIQISAREQVCEDLQKQLNGAFDRWFISKDKIKAEMEDIIDYFEYVNATSEDMEFLEKKKKELLEGK